MFSPSRFVLVLALALSLVSAGPVSSPHALHEKRSAMPRGWIRARRLEPAATVPLRIGLTQSNLEKLEEHLMTVSHPDSPQYGQHWSASDIVNYFAPSSDSVNAVIEWLAQEGIPRDRLKLSTSKTWIDVVGGVTAEEAERLLKTEYHVFEDEEGGQKIGCHEYSIPQHLQKHVDVVSPTINLGVPSPRNLNSKKRGTKVNLGSPSSFNGPKLAPANDPVFQQRINRLKNPGSTTLGINDCDEFITPVCLRTLYNFENVVPKETKKNTFGIVEFTPQAFLQPDLDMFFKNFSTPNTGMKPDLISIDGGVAQTTQQSFNFNGESSLDLEYGFALTAPQPILLLQTGDLVEGAGFDNWLDAIDASFCTFEGGDDPTQDGIYPDTLPGGFDEPESCGIIKPPNVVSVSYGQDEVTISAKSAERQCTEYGKIGLAGTSVFYSSGDFGVAGFDNVCLFPNDTEDESASNPAAVRFNPSFPSGCPFITSVGATQVNPNSTVFEPEGACEQVIFSGGGFSNVFAMPSYQETVVKNFLREHPPPFSAAQFNNSGRTRAFPDLAANGANYVIGIDGEFELVFGTSASAPTTASIFTLINDARLQIGKGPVGFINPAIYNPLFQIGFHDITTGGNQGCGTAGFTATKGWDPVTGLGTPNFQILKDLFLALP